jgi:hypothetical protein
MGHGDAEMTPARTRSQFSLYCVMAANLMMTGNLTRVDPFVLETWGSPAAIAINQDPLGLPFRVLPIHNSTTAVSATPDARAVTVTECGGEPTLQVWEWAADGLVRNTGGGSAAVPRCMNVKACKTTVIVDTCLETGPGCGGAPAGAPAANEVFQRPPAPGGAATVTLNNRTSCLTAATDGSVSILPCKEPVSPGQRLSYDPATKHITRVSDGSCLTAPTAAAPPGPPGTNMELMLGRPLQHGKWAIGTYTKHCRCLRFVRLYPEIIHVMCGCVLGDCLLIINGSDILRLLAITVMVNNHASERTLTCAEECFAAMGFVGGEPPAGATLFDVWGGDLGPVGEAISLVVPPSGASRLVVLTV